MKISWKLPVTMTFVCPFVESCCVFNKSDVPALTNLVCVVVPSTSQDVKPWERALVAVSAYI